MAFVCSYIGSLGRRTAVLIVVALSVLPGLYGQNFHFGVTAAAITSQVDGDNLRGFNKLGFNVGLLSGYSLSTRSALVVELQYATFGSGHGQEYGVATLETEIKTLNVFTGYILRFGDAWDGSKKFRLSIGPRIHAIQKAELGGKEGKGMLKRYFVSANVGVGAFLSEHLIVDLNFNHGLSNILKTEMEDFQSLQPYYLALGLTYYLYK